MPTIDELRNDVKLLKALRERTKNLLDRLLAGEEISAEERDQYLVDRDMTETQLKSNQN